MSDRTDVNLFEANNRVRNIWFLERCSLFNGERHVECTDRLVNVLDF